MNEPRLYEVDAVKVYKTCFQQLVVLLKYVTHKDIRLCLHQPPHKLLQHKLSFES